ncbi:hypothetical protein V2I01_15220 [Micromonospora sp. BRA006-A]|nr:hypothetical protein [Micromonospora sp. BRA006-A]
MASGAIPSDDPTRTLVHARPDDPASRTSPSRAAPTRSWSPASRRPAGTA